MYAGSVFHCFATTSLHQHAVLEICARYDWHYSLYSDQYRLPEGAKEVYVISLNGLDEIPIMLEFLKNMDD